MNAFDRWPWGKLVLLAGAVLLMLCASVFMWHDEKELNLRKAWCATVCGAQRVLVCQEVNDPAWPKARRAVGCMIDPEGREVRFVTEKP